MKKSIRNNSHKLLFVFAAIALFIVFPNHIFCSEGSTSQNDSLDQKARIEFQKQKSQMVYWFSNRKIEDRKYQKEYRKIRNQVLKRLKKTNLIRVERGSIDNGNGIGQWKADTIYYTDDIFNETEWTTTFTHELSHDAFPVIRVPESKFRCDMPQWMIDLIDEAIKNSTYIDLGKENRSWNEYFYRSEEIYANICSFRLVFNLKPKQVISMDQLHLFVVDILSGKITNVDSENLIVIINDHNFLLKLINSLP
jgi:hypothetical protein